MSSIAPLLFFGVCIPTRAALSYAASVLKPASQEESVARGAAAVLGGIWVTGIPFNKESKPTTFLGNDVWWNDLRPVHGLLWLAYAITGESGFLFADTGLGAVAGVVKFA